MAATDALTEKRLRLKRNFGDFLEQDHGYGQYPEDIRRMMTEGKLRLGVAVDDLRDFNADLQRELFDDPADCIPAFEDALDEYVKHNYPKRLEDNQQVGRLQLQTFAVRLLAAAPSQPLNGASFLFSQAKRLYWLPEGRVCDCCSLHISIGVLPGGLPGFSSS